MSTTRPWVRIKIVRGVSVEVCVSWILPDNFLQELQSIVVSARQYNDHNFSCAMPECGRLLKVWTEARDLLWSTYDGTEDVGVNIEADGWFSMTLSRAASPEPCSSLSRMA